MGDDRGRGVAAAALHDQAHAIGGEDFDGGDERRLRQGVGVHTGKERTGNAAPGAVFGDGLADGEDVALIEAAGGRRAAMPRRAEGDLLGRVGRVGVGGVIGGHQPRDVDQGCLGGGLAG